MKGVLFFRFQTAIPPLAIRSSSYVSIWTNLPSANTVAFATSKITITATEAETSSSLGGASRALVDGSRVTIADVSAAVAYSDSEFDDDK